jgi:outer membrane protein
LPNVKILNLWRAPSDHKKYKIKQMKNLIIFLITAAVFTGNIMAQDTILDSYVKQGLESNLALKQKMLSYDQSLASLEEAKGMFFPNISLNARYSVASGGRTIDFPVGDLLNPVYNSLNALTAGLPPGQQFPETEIENQKFYFFRPTEHETKLSLTQAIFSPKIGYNYRIKKDLATAEQVDVNLYKRQLVAEIKKAYYQYLQSWYVKQLLDQTKVLVVENVRVNESLFKNDKVTVDVVDRSRTEVSKIEQQTADAEKNLNVTKSWFNFLLNRPLHSEIIRIENPSVEPVNVDVETALGSAMENREELDMIETYADIAEKSMKLNKMNKVPELFGAIDYGLQGQYYEITEDADFFLGSLVLRWDIFTGKQNNAKIQRAQIEQKIVNERYEELKQQINLEVIAAWYDLVAAEKSIEAARKGRESANSAFNLINKKYQQGQASLIEFLDARNSKNQFGGKLYNFCSRLLDKIYRA